MKLDETTRMWIRNASDEAAMANGCTFDVERAAYAVWWIERYCKLYEGEQAGEQLVLYGCHDCGTTPTDIELGDWDGPNARKIKRAAFRRAEKHCHCYAAGHRLD